MASVFVQVCKILLIAVVFFVSSIYSTIMMPFTKSKRDQIRSKISKLNAAAVHRLGKQAKENYVTIPDTGITLHVVEAGDPKNKLIVLLHGFPDCWIAYKNIIPKLVKAEYYVVAPDLRGYNLSDKPVGVNNYELTKLVGDISGLISHYSQGKAVVVSHDWGAPIAWELCAAFPHKVEKLIALNGPHPRKFFKLLTQNRLQQLASWYILFIQIPYLTRNLFVYDPEWTAKTVFQTNKNKSILNSDDIELLASAYSQPYAMEAMLNYYKSALREIMSKKGSASFSKNPYRKPCTTPALIIWGLLDEALIKENALVDDWAPNTKVLYLPNCSHWVPHEAPSVVCEKILEFIAQ